MAEFSLQNGETTTIAPFNCGLIRERQRRLVRCEGELTPMIRVCSASESELGIITPSGVECVKAYAQASRSTVYVNRSLSAGAAECLGRTMIIDVPRPGPCDSAQMRPP